MFVSQVGRWEDEEEGLKREEGKQKKRGEERMGERQDGTRTQQEEGGGDWLGEYSRIEYQRKSQESRIADRISRQTASSL
jgi:hypothetical protein